MNSLKKMPRLIEVVVPSNGHVAEVKVLETVYDSLRAPNLEKEQNALERNIIDSFNGDKKENSKKASSIVKERMFELGYDNIIIDLEHVRTTKSEAPWTSYMFQIRKKLL